MIYLRLKSWLIEDQNLALLNIFSNADDEHAYLRSERLSRRLSTRVLLAITILLFLIFGALNSQFFADQDMTGYYFATGVMIAVLVTALVLTGTRLYLEQRLFDVVLFVLSVSAIAAITIIMASMKPEFATSVQRMATANLNALYVYNSIIFVANFRYFLRSVLGLTVVYLIFLAMIGLSASVVAIVMAKLSVYLLFAIFVNWVIDRHAREVFATEQELKVERQKSENLLYKVLPRAVARRLRAGKSVASSFENVTVVFADIIDSSALAHRLSPEKLVEELNRFFTTADECADRNGIEKVKTIGDAYLAVTGGISSGEKGAAEAIAFARDLIASMERQAKQTGMEIKLRIGIHTGPVVGGVVGSRRLAYDYWGDTMNIASRIQHQAKANGIVVSSNTYAQCGNLDDFGLMESVDLKGIGPTLVYPVRMESEQALEAA